MCRLQVVLQLRREVGVRGGNGVYRGQSPIRELRFSERALRELFRTPGLFVLAQREPLGLAHPFLGNLAPIDQSRARILEFWPVIGQLPKNPVRKTQRFPLS